MITKTLSVSAIKDGTVIDHIAAGQALKIMQLLSLTSSENEITIGLNLQSEMMYQKDIIKVSGKELTAEECHSLAIFAPHASVNIINDYEVIKKTKVTIPKELRGSLLCPNPCCITNNEPMSTFFLVSYFQRMIHLSCHYCEKTFPQNIMQLKGSL